MRKFIIGLLIGLSLGLPFSAMADSMVGKKIETEVAIKLDGEYLSVGAIGLEGRTYAPVRALAEALGKEVGWDGEVIIASPEEVGDKMADSNDLSKPSDDSIDRIEILKKDIIRYTNLIDTYRHSIKYSEEIGAPAESIAQLEKVIEYWQNKIEQYKQQLAELEQATE